MAGLELDDVSFDRRTITIRPNRWRRLETRTSHRVIPLWPRLDAILRAWVFGPRLERGGTLLVPSWTARGEERRLQDISKLLGRVAEACRARERHPPEPAVPPAPTARPGSRHSTAERR